MTIDSSGGFLLVALFATRESRKCSTILVTCSVPSRGLTPSPCNRMLVLLENMLDLWLSVHIIWQEVTITTMFALYLFGHMVQGASAAMCGMKIVSLELMPRETLI